MSKRRRRTFWIPLPTQPLIEVRSSFGQPNGGLSRQVARGPAAVGPTDGDTCHCPVTRKNERWMGWDGSRARASERERGGSGRQREAATAAHDRQRAGKGGKGKPRCDPEGSIPVREGCDPGAGHESGRVGRATPWTDRILGWGDGTKRKGKGVCVERSQGGVR